MTRPAPADALVVLSLAAAACGDAPAPPPRAEPEAAPPRLLLVTLDTTRADRLGCYGHAAARTPCLDELAARGVVYESAWTAAPITLSSHVTILTGVYPCAHGVRENGAFEVAPAARLLSEALQEAGFRTGAFVGAFVLDAKFGLSQGFDAYLGADASRLGGKWGVIERPAAAVADDALAFVDRLASDDRFFLWVHFYDPHHPYQPPAGFDAAGLDGYDAEIAYCDAQLRRILDRLRERGLDRGLVVAVTADHGEGLGEHGEKTHGIFVYEATMRVPLLIAPPPEGVAPGTRVRAPVSNADLAVTLLERLGVGRGALPDARTPPLSAVEKLPAADGDGGEDGRAIYLESLTPYFSHRQHPLRAVVWKGLKYVESARPELYSLREDPAENRDLARERPDLRERCAVRLRALVAEHASLPWGSANADAGADANRLQALGYAGAQPGGDPFGEEGLPDPKDRIGDLDLLDRIVAAVRDGSLLLELDGSTQPDLPPDEAAQRRRFGRARLEEALRLVDELRAGNPGDPMVPLMLSTILLGLGRHPEAVTVLEEIVARNPRHPINHYNLSHAYSKTGRPDWARRELEKTVFLEPRSLYALRLLVEIAWRDQDPPAAAWWLDRLAECPGRSEEEIAAMARRREMVQQELDRTGAGPRPPAPIGEDELLPEGRRAAEEGR